MTTPKLPSALTQRSLISLNRFHQADSPRTASSTRQRRSLKKESAPQSVCASMKRFGQGFGHITACFILSTRGKKKMSIELSTSSNSWRLRETKTLLNQSMWMRNDDDSSPLPSSLKFGKETVANVGSVKQRTNSTLITFFPFQRVEPHSQPRIFNFCAPDITSKNVTIYNKHKTEAYLSKLTHDS